MTEQQARIAANLIVTRLFVNSMGQHATRLVLTFKGGRDLGGWCKQAVIDQIVRVLCE